MTTKLKKATLFFAANAGYSTPPGKMACALALAKAEQVAEDNDWTAEWEDDPSGCSGCDCGSKDCACSSGADHQTLGCVMKDASGKVLASLWGICGATNEYARVVEAELAQEALAEFESEREEHRWASECALT